MFLTAITFLIILTVLVLIHEFGHFIVARWVGVHVEEFGLGLPPRIGGKMFGKTLYSLNWLPIGGFVRLSGEDEDPAARPSKLDARSKKQYFWARSKKERLAILSAGVFMNFFLAVAITGFLLVTGVKEPTGRVHVERVVIGTPADTAGLMVGDYVLGLGLFDDATAQTSTLTQPKTPAELITFVNAHKGEQVRILLERPGESEQKIVTVTPRVVVPKGEGPLGVAISDLEMHKYSWQDAPGKALMINFVRARDMLTSLGATLWRLVTLRAPDAQIAGPIGIAQVTGEAVKFGWMAVLEFASILSLNLAVLNILPVPALDGGRVAFVVFEKIFRKRVNPVFERNAHQVGMIILFALIFLVSINDILRLVRGG